jgi:hypothetical protein
MLYILKIQLIFFGALLPFLDVACVPQRITSDLRYLFNF